MGKGCSNRRGGLCCCCGCSWLKAIDDTEVDAIEVGAGNIAARGAEQEPYEI